MSAQPVTREDQAAAQVIEAERAHRGTPKTVLADRAGISRRALYNYLDGKTALSVGTFWALCAALDLPSDVAAQRVRVILNPPEDTERK